MCVGLTLHCIEVGGVAPSFVITPNANEKYAISVNVMRFPWAAGLALRMRLCSCSACATILMQLRGNQRIQRYLCDAAA